MKPNFAKLNEPVIELDEPMIDIGPNGTSLDLLQAIYRSTSMPRNTRMRAAVAALPFEYPKFVAVAQFNENSFAARLEQRIQRMRLIEARPIEEGSQPQETEGTQPEIIEGPKPAPPKKITDPALPFTTLRRRV
jgi:hypothetical protein